MNHGKLVDLIADEIRTIERRFKIANARADELGDRANEAEAEGEEEELVNRRIVASDRAHRIANDLRWRLGELKKAANALEEAHDHLDGVRQRLARKRGK